MEPLTKSELAALVLGAILGGIIGAILVDTFFLNNTLVTNFIMSFS